MIKSNHKISTKFKNQAGRLYTKEIRVFGNSKNRTGASLFSINPRKQNE
jgi:hypothetical protein